MSELAADGVPVAVACRVLGLARQPYYRWLRAAVTDADLTRAYRADALFDAHREGLLHVWVTGCSHAASAVDGVMMVS